MHPFDDGIGCTSRVVGYMALARFDASALASRSSAIANSDATS
jgi:Fic family protein